MQFKVSIPQAVGTVATVVGNVNGECISIHVSIPQAVGTVATAEFYLMSSSYARVSIPQAVGTVATDDIGGSTACFEMFQYRKR